jgi:hypothetical protein
MSIIPASELRTGQLKLIALQQYLQQDHDLCAYQPRLLSTPPIFALCSAEDNKGRRHTLEIETI